MASINRYVQGDLVRVFGDFTINADGDPIDPTDVFVKYRAPGSDPVEFESGVDAELVRDEEGSYHLDIDTTDAHGTYRYRVYSTGTGQAANEGQFFVAPSAVD